MGIMMRVMSALGLSSSKKAATKKAPAKKPSAKAPVKKKTVSKATPTKAKKVVKVAKKPAAKAKTPTKAAAPAKKPSAKKPAKRVLAPHGGKPLSSAKRSKSTKASAFQSTYLELVSGTSSKYWKIIFLDATTTQVFNGRIGAAKGQAQDPKEHATEAAANTHYAKLVKSKLNKGYVYATP